MAHDQNDRNPVRSVPSRREVTAEQIAHLAYQRWLDRGRPSGSPLQDWIDAERDLNGRPQRIATAERRLAAEHAVVRILAGAGQLAAAAPDLLRAVGEHLGWDWGAIWTLDDATQLLRCDCVWARPGREVPEFERLSLELFLPRGLGLPGRVWETGEPAWIENPIGDPDYVRWRPALADGIQSAFAFPIGDAERFLGVIEFISHELRAPDSDLLETMTQIGVLIGQFAERRRAEETLHRRDAELGVARKIQSRLLPAAPPAPPGLTIAAACEPAYETGGDYFDFLRLPGGALGIAVGDASGHGTGPALIIAETRAYLRAFSVIETDPGRLLTRVNRCLAEDLDDNFVTLFLARLDPVKRELTYSSAGHWPAYLFGHDGGTKAKMPSNGIPLGLDPRTEFITPPPIRLAAGDLLLVLTDGVVEAMSPAGDLFGTDRMFAALRGHAAAPLEDVLRTLLACADEFCQGRITDDRTVVLARTLS